METPSQKPKQRDITMFTIKQAPIQGLKLTLVRDPRTLTVKKPAQSPARAAHPPPAPTTSSSTSPAISDLTRPNESVTPSTDVRVPPKGSGGASSSKKQHSQLPVSRVKMVMKTNVKSTQNSLSGVSQESVVVVTKAAELFIAQLAKEASKVAEEQTVKEVTYKHLATAVRRNSDQMRFLYDILPEKVLYRDYLASLNPAPATDSATS